jgi:hypothetical protein
VLFQSRLRELIKDGDFLAGCISVGLHYTQKASSAAAFVRPSNPRRGASPDFTVSQHGTLALFYPVFAGFNSLQSSRVGDRPSKANKSLAPVMMSVNLHLLCGS